MQMNERPYIKLRTLILALISIPAIMAFHTYEASSKQDYIIEIIQLSITEDNSAVEIVFWLDEAVVTGEVLFHRERFDPDISQFTFNEFEKLEIDDLEPYDEENNWYVFRDINPESSPYRYYLALDIDGARDYTYIHGTILQHQFSYDNCTHELTLSWDHYITDPKPGGDTGPSEYLFTHYQIIHNDQETEIVGYDDSTDQQEMVITLEEPGNNVIRVRAIDSANPDLTRRYSYSNTVEGDFDWPELDAVVIENVDVTGLEEVELTIRVDGDDFNRYSYSLERSRDREDGYEVVDGDLVAPANTFSVTDVGVQGLEDGIWYYRVRAHLLGEDQTPCEDPAVVSEPVSTLWLFAELGEQQPDALPVNIQFDRDPDAYACTLEEMLPGDNEFSEASVNIGSPYIYHLPLEPPLIGAIKFRIKCEEGGMEFYSNEVELFIEPEIRIPNAFRPESAHMENKVFAPMFPPGFEYSVTIYNRNGLVIYSSGLSDNEQWDGNINGRPAPGGTYLYHIRYSVPGNDMFDGEKKGAVYLVR